MRLDSVIRRRHTREKYPGLDFERRRDANDRFDRRARHPTLDPADTRRTHLREFPEILEGDPEPLSFRADASADFYGSGRVSFGHQSSVLDLCAKNQGVHAQATNTQGVCGF